jgi:hypothetical protein
LEDPEKMTTLYPRASYDVALKALFYDELILKGSPRPHKFNDTTRLEPSDRFDDVKCRDKVTARPGRGNHNLNRRGA